MGFFLSRGIVCLIKYNLPELKRASINRRKIQRGRKIATHHGAKGFHKVGTAKSKLSQMVLEGNIKCIAFNNAAHSRLQWSEHATVKSFVVVAKVYCRNAKAPRRYIFLAVWLSPLTVPPS